MTESVLIIHGLGGSGPDHWQSWLAGSLRSRGVRVAYPELPDPDEPRLGAWLGAMDKELSQLDPARLIVVCHSLGSVTWLQLAVRSDRRLAERVLLVAPPSAGAGVPEIAEFVPAPLDPAAVARAGRETRVVCADTNDPYCPEGPSLWEPLGVGIDEIEGGGHLNTDAGYGPWPAVETWCLDPTHAPITAR